MEQRRLKIEKEGQEAMAILAQLRDPYAALLYALLASRPGGSTEAEAAKALAAPEDRIQRAAELLIVYGLANTHTAPPPRREETPPAEELALTRRNDPAFSGLCDYFESAKGRFLNRRELETLLNVYQALSLPPEVLTLLIGDCARRNRLTAREVEKQAYRWYDKGLDNFEAASAYLERCRNRETHGAHVLSLFHIEGRLPGESEQKYIDAWESMGISDELLQLAFDRTLLGAQRMSWPYLNKILLSWQEKGLKTVQQVEKYERDGRKPTAAIPEPRESVETIVLRRMQQKRQQRALELENRREALRRGSPAFAENESALRLCASRMARAKPSEKSMAAREYQGFLAKQSEILLQLGKPEDWLTDKPDCPICGDRGYVGTQKCRCLIRACEAEEQKRS